MSFHVGQRVVCVDDRVLPCGTIIRGCQVVNNLHRLSKGQIYTIRGLGKCWMTDEPAIFLNEIVRPLLSGEGAETPYRATRFRPVKDTSIDIFTAMLAPAPKQKVRA